MSYRDEFNKWLESDALSDAEKAELLSVRDDEKEVEDRFFSPLQFGTAGLRGVMGMGINRMNAFVVRQTTQGLAELITQEGGDAMSRGVCIAYDCRVMSREFAREASCVLAANGIKVYLFDELRPTPELSFAILQKRAIAGINITASHNPKEYNGYKAYWEDGAQLPPRHADIVQKACENVDVLTGARLCGFDEALADGRIVMLGGETDEAFLEKVTSEAICPEEVRKCAGELSVVFTPFHGAGYRLVPEALRRIGFERILCVPEQMVLDGTFPTVKSPNPENREGFDLAARVARENGASMVIGTDPDADRVGLLVRRGDGEFVTLSGNQIGVLLLEYIITARGLSGTMPENPCAIASLVSTKLANKIAEQNGLKFYETFTGFKFIAEKANRLRENGENYIFSFEESHGYMIGSHCRDKDAVCASMLIGEMAAYWHNRGLTLYDALLAIFEKYGHFAERTMNLVMPGVDGLLAMRALMDGLRAAPPQEIAGTRAAFVRDYLDGTRRAPGGEAEKMELSGSNVLYYELEDGSTVIVRPSGTEPKVKVYLLVSGRDEADCLSKLDGLEKWGKALVSGS